MQHVHDTLAPRSTSLWLGDGADPPQLAYALPPWPEERTEPLVAPGSVLRCLAQGAPVVNELSGEVALPLLTPSTGLLGALHLAAGNQRAWDAETVGLLDGLAYEASFALQAAHLYERAIAERDKSRAVLDRVGDGVIVTTPQGRVLQINGAAQRLLRIGSDGTGDACESLLGLHEDQRPLACAGGCPLLDPSRRSADTLGCELWRTLPDGTRQPVLVSVEPIRDPDGAVAEVVHSLRDITKLKEADEAKTLFLATATHELKTPLTVITGFAKTLVSGGPLPVESQREALSTILRRSEELSAIVDRLLLASRIESAQLEVEPVEVDLLPLVSERAGALGTVREREINVELPEELPTVHADPYALKTILDHLLDNAVKFSPESEPVLITALPAEREGERGVELRITDRGIGLDPVEAAHVFDKFWQAESSTTRRFGGSGIGLYIVRALVDAMGGEITVTSVPGSGSTFTVWLPEALGAPTEAPARVRHLQTVPTPKGEPSTIREFMRQMGIPERQGRR